MRKTVEERFWAKVKKTRACWLWQGACAGDGDSPVFWFNKAQHQATRFAWELLVGKIPPGLFVCHNCPGGDNPRCINPKHMFLGTHRENLLDASKKGMLATAKDGEANPQAKLTDEAVMEIRRRYVKGSRRGPNSSYKLAKEFGVTQGWLRAIAKGSHWNHLAKKP
jgi:hypothetical protein